LFERLRDFNDRIDRENLRVRRPHHVIFLCGGLTPKGSADSSVISVRDYLYRIRPIKNRVTASIVLAETAQQIYRDTTYNDLISFEEDIARIASIVLLISESPGSLAELGSFSSEPVIREALRIIVSEEYSSAESFVRYGPIKRIETLNRSNIGIFPWKTNKANGHVVKSSIQPHYKEIVTFIKNHLSIIPDSFGYEHLAERAIFFDILWILSLLEAIPPDPLYSAVRLIHPDMTDGKIKNILYTMQVCNWIDVFSYSGRDYYFLPLNQDPFVYAFKSGMRVRDVAATKVDIVTSFQQAASISKAVLKRLLEKRSSR
jgi:hypothetical protein